MNARQKAKRYKRLYETLSKQPLPVIFKEPYHVETLRYERAYPEELIANTCFMQEDGNLMIIDKEAKEEIDFIQPKKLCMKNVTDFISAIATPNASAYIQMDIARGLAEGLDKYIVYKMNYDPEMNVYRICGEIKVVER